MSKKSRKRNKKILAMLTIAGGAALAAKRKRAGEMSGKTTVPDSQKETVSRSAPVVKTPSPIQSKPPTLYRPNNKTLASPKWNNWSDDSAPDGSGNYVSPRKRSRGYGTGLDDAYAAKDGGRIGKKSGGRTGYKSGGAAKRGFGKEIK